MYHEKWIRATRDLWHLERAYLNIYRITEFSEEEFLCLHCDPTEADDAPHALYKKGPHLHISVATPIKHAHIALDGGAVGSVLANLDALTATLTWAIQMIRDEVLDQVD